MRLCALLRDGLLPLGLVLVVGIVGCGRTDSLLIDPPLDTDSTTVSFEDDGPGDEGDEGDEGEAEAEWGEEAEEAEADWGDESNDEWSDEEESDDWGEEDEADWGEEEESSDWGEEEESSDWGEEEESSDWGEESTDEGCVFVCEEESGESTSEGTSEVTDEGNDPECSDAVECLVDCGNYTQECVGPCLEGLPDEDLGQLFDLQFCALQACFFAGICEFGNFGADECVECRLLVSSNPDPVCVDQGAACGVI